MAEVPPDDARRLSGTVLRPPSLVHARGGPTTQIIMPATEVDIAQPITVAVGRGGAVARGIAPSVIVEPAAADALDGLDYATLALVIAAFLGVTAQTDDPHQGLIACMALYIVLSWAPTRRALRILLRDMQGRD
jgi:hypothetical protein